MELSNQNTRSLRLVHDDGTAFEVEGILRHKRGEIFVVYNSEMEPILPFHVDKLKKVQEISSSGAVSDITSELNAVCKCAIKSQFVICPRDALMENDDAEKFVRAISKPTIARASSPAPLKPLHKPQVIKPLARKRQESVTPSPERPGRLMSAFFATLRRKKQTQLGTRKGGHADPNVVRTQGTTQHAGKRASSS